MISQSEAEDFYSEMSYEKEKTIIALNYALMSCFRIKETNDRIILDQEFENILNNLKFSEIKADYELISIYQNILQSITQKRINYIDREFIEKIYNNKLRNNIYQSLMGIRAYGGDPKSVMLSLAISAGSTYFNYQQNKQEYQLELDKSLWEIKKENMQNYSSQCESFLEHMWVLLNKYQIPDQYRITDSNIRSFLEAIEDVDLQRALRKLNLIQDNFSYYPPFWYYHGMIAEKLGNYSLANESFKMFEQAQKGILRKNPYYSEVAKHQVQIYLSEKPVNREEIARLVNIITDNSIPEKDWTNYFVSSIALASINDLDNALNCIQINLDFETETDLSLQLKHCIQADTFDLEYWQPFLTNFQRAKKEELKNKFSNDLLWGRIDSLSFLFDNPIKEIWMGSKYIYCAIVQEGNLLWASKKIPVLGNQTIFQWTNEPENQFAIFPKDLNLDLTIKILKSNTPDPVLVGGTTLSGAMFGATVGALIALPLGGVTAPVGALIGGAIGGVVGGSAGGIEGMRGDTVLLEKIVESNTISNSLSNELVFSNPAGKSDLAKVKFITHNLPMIRNTEAIISDKEYLAFLSIQLCENSCKKGEKDPKDCEYVLELIKGNNIQRMPKDNEINLLPMVVEPLLWERLSGEYYLEPFKLKLIEKDLLKDDIIIEKDLPYMFGRHNLTSEDIFSVELYGPLSE